MRGQGYARPFAAVIFDCPARTEGNILQIYYHLRREFFTLFFVKLQYSNIKKCGRKALVYCNAAAFIRQGFRSPDESGRLFRPKCRPKGPAAQTCAAGPFARLRGSPQSLRDSSPEGEPSFFGALRRPALKGSRVFWCFTATCVEGEPRLASR